VGVWRGAWGSVGGRLEVDLGPSAMATSPRHRDPTQPTGSSSLTASLKGVAPSPTHQWPRRPRALLPTPQPTHRRNLRGPLCGALNLRGLTWQLTWQLTWPLKTWGWRAQRVGRACGATGPRPAASGRTSPHGPTCLFGRCPPPPCAAFWAPASRFGGAASRVAARPVGFVLWTVAVGRSLRAASVVVRAPVAP